MYKVIFLNNGPFYNITVLNYNIWYHICYVAAASTIQDPIYGVAFHLHRRFNKLSESIKMFDTIMYHLSESSKQPKLDM